MHFGYSEYLSSRAPTRRDSVEIESRDQSDHLHVASPQLLGDALQIRSRAVQGSARFARFASGRLRSASRGLCIQSVVSTG